MTASKQGSPPGNHFTTVRLVLALMVLAAHACEFVDGDRSREPLTRIFGTLSLGEVAVDGFFVVSGFLILHSWQRSPNAVVFFRKRASRIYPGFIVASLVAIFAFGPFGSPYPARYLLAICQGSAVIPYCLVLLLPPKTPFIFPGLRYNSVQGALWTIHYEFCCYIVLAALGVAGFLKRPIVATLWAGALITYVALGLGAGPAGSPVAPSEGLGVVVRFALFFLSGAVLAQSSLSLACTPARLVAALTMLTLGLSFRLWAEPTLATFGAWLIVMTGRSRRYRCPLPDLSYGLYLYGTPVELLLVFHGRGLSPVDVFMGAVLGAGLLGMASWRWIEAPSISWGRRAEVC